MSLILSGGIWLGPVNGGVLNSDAIVSALIYIEDSGAINQYVPLKTENRVLTISSPGAGCDYRLNRTGFYGEEGGNVVLVGAPTLTVSDTISGYTYTASVQGGTWIPGISFWTRYRGEEAVLSGVLTARITNFAYRLISGTNYTVNVTGSNVAITGNGTYGPNSQVTVTATPVAGYRIVSAIIGGVDVTAQILAGGYSFVMPADDITGEIIVVPEIITISGSYSVESTGCKLSPYANLGHGNVLIQPRATIFVNGINVADGATSTVDYGKSASIFVSSESIYTRIASMIVNGVEYAAGGNWASRSISLEATSDVTVTVKVVADRFCYQTGGGAGAGEIPQKPITPPTSDDDGIGGGDGTGGSGGTGGGQGPIIPPRKPDPPVPPKPPSPPSPPTPVEPPGEPVPVPGVLPIDFTLHDLASGVELLKVNGVYQAKNTQWIEYRPIQADPPYTWVFGDRSADSSLEKPSHRYYFSKACDFLVTLYANYEGTTTQTWVSKQVHITVDESSGGDPDDDPPVIVVDPSWPDIFRTGFEGLTLRWRDEMGAWSKERKITLDRKFPTVWINRMGKYRVRQWEIVMVDALPQVVVYVEEEVEVLDDRSS